MYASNKEAINTAPACQESRWGVVSTAKSGVRGGYRAHVKYIHRDFIRMIPNQERVLPDRANLSTLPVIPTPFLHRIRKPRRKVDWHFWEWTPSRWRIQRPGPSCSKLVTCPFITLNTDKLWFQQQCGDTCLGDEDMRKQSIALIHVIKVYHTTRTYSRNRDRQSHRQVYPKYPIP